MTFPFGVIAPEGLNLERMRLHRFQEHDNVIVSGITSGDVLEWDGTDWANVPNGGGATSTLQALADVSLAGSVFPEVLMYEGQRSCTGTADSTWHNAQLIACMIEPGPSPFGTAVAERFIFPETLDVGVATPAGEGAGWTNEGLVVPVDSSEVADEVFADGVYFNHDTASANAKAARRTVMRTAHVTGTDPLVMGHELVVELGAAGAVTDLIGERLQLVITGNGNVAEAIGTRIRAFTQAGAGTVTDAVSLDIEDQTIGTNDIAIRTGANQHEYNGVGYLWPGTPPVATDVLTVQSIAAGVATLTWATPVGGSGTANTLAKWSTGGTDLEDSQITDDGTDLTIALAGTGIFDLQVSGVSALNIDGSGSLLDRVINVSYDHAPGIGAIGRGMVVNGFLREAASGTHALLAGIEINPPSIVVGAATVTNAASVYINGATAAVVTGDNYALLVNGAVQFNDPLTMDGEINLVAATAARPSMNIPPTATIPSTPADGDVWFTSAGLFVEVSSTTIGPLVGGTGTADAIPLWTTDGELTDSVLEQVLTPGLNADAWLVRATGTIDEFTSGTHALLAGVRLEAPTVTVGVATVTDTAVLYVAGPMTATVTGANYSLWVDAGTTRLDGDLTHQGTLLGFYGATPVAQPAAYTQTYATATRTHAAPTAAALTDSSTGTASQTIGAIAGSGADAGINNNFASVTDEINKLIADLANLKQLANSMIDDFQLNGLLQ